MSYIKNIWKNGITEFSDNNLNNIENGIETIDKSLFNISNYNLLINSDFQIWQRGNDFQNISWGHYTSDRWNCATVNGIMNGIVITRSNDGIKIKNSLNIGNIHLRQPIEYKDISEKNEQFTLSVKFKDVGTFTVSGIINKDSFISKQIDLGGNCYIIKAVCDSNKNIGVELISNALEWTVEWAKLEKGSIQTPFVSRLYGEELNLCQRYYEVISRDYRGVAMSDSDGRFAFQIPFLVEKRIKPIITSSDLTNTIEVISIANTTPTNISMDSTEKGIRIFGFVDKIYSLRNLSTTWGFSLSCDSEIY